MYFDEQNEQNTELENTMPQNGAGTGSDEQPTPQTPPQPMPQPSGEYHYTRENNPGAGAEPQMNRPPYQQERRSNSYNENPYNNNGYQGSYNGYTSAYQAPSGQGGRRSGGMPPQPPRKQKKSGVGLGAVIAVALVCAIIGGLVGAGGLYALSSGGFITGNRNGTATVAVSDRTAEDNGNGAEKVQIKAGEQMTPAQIYSTYGSAVASVTVTTSSGEGAGTGFVIDGKNGYLLTCYHVIDGASAISVTMTDSTSYEATYIGGDQEQDVAVIKIVPEEGKTLDLPTVVLGDSSILAVGDGVSAIGNALGTLANTLTSGYVSALDRAISMSDGTVMNLMQTDTTINSGNSGGPLFNQYGEVIGIVNAKYSSSGSSYGSGTASIEGIGFAIPINDVTDIMDDLIKHGYITGKPYLGISVATVSSLTAQQYKNMVVGAYVSSVNSGSCAEKAGLKVGDIITQVDGTDITTSAELIDMKSRHRAGEEMILLVYRDEDTLTMKVTLDEEKPSKSPISDGSEKNQQQNNGGSYDYGYGFGNGGFGYGFPFNFFGN